jgi:hypothetical protein
MNFDLLTAEHEAAQSLSDLITQAKRCRDLHERARMALPEPLKRMLGINTNGSKKPVVSIPPPERPSLPVGADSDWVCIKASDAYPTSVALAVLRGSDGPMMAKDVVSAVTDILPNVRRGSINNVGTRLHGKEIKRSKEGWELIHPETAPILQDGMIWGSPTVFGKQELAVHRREAVLHLIRTVPAGLQTSQIIDHLKNCAWVHAPISKELVQDDVEYWFAENKIKRSGNSKKWVVRPERNGNEG